MKYEVMNDDASVQSILSVKEHQFVNKIKHIDLCYCFVIFGYCTIVQ